MDEIYITHFNDLKIKAVCFHIRQPLGDVIVLKVFIQLPFDPLLALFFYHCQSCLPRLGSVFCFTTNRHNMCTHTNH